MRYSFMSVSRGRVDSLHSACKVGEHNPNKAATFIGKVLAVEGTPLGCDLLIGMDVIGLGDFMVSCCDGTTHFGFRTPSELSKEDMAALMQ